MCQTVEQKRETERTCKCGDGPCLVEAKREQKARKDLVIPDLIAAA